MLVVDTCVLIDIADADADHGESSVACIEEQLDQGLLVSPVSYVELAPVFAGSRSLLDEFLDGLGVDRSAVFDITDRSAAFSAWARHISAKRGRRASKRPVADALIGALALRHDGLIARNGDDFRFFYPDLRIIDPSAPRRRDARKAPRSAGRGGRGWPRRSGSCPGRAWS